MNKKDIENVAWIIKHRPKTIKEVVGNEAALIQKFINNGNIPHLLFYSRTPGTGKTTIAKALINDLQSDYLEINSSMDRGIDNIRNRVKQFVTTTSTNGQKKIVFLDEFDGMLKPVQDALRNMMEQFASNVIFILTCNYIEKVIEPIKNRCEVFSFGSADKKDIYSYVENICKIEGVKYTPEGLTKLIDIHYPSIRNVVGDLQKFFTLDLVVDANNVKKDSEIFDDLFQKLLDKKVLTVRKEIVTKGIEPELFINYLFDKTIDGSLSNKSLIKLSRVLAELDYRIKIGGDKKIQLLSSLFDIYGAVVLE